MFIATREKDTGIKSFEQEGAVLNTFNVNLNHQDISNKFLVCLELWQFIAN